MSGECSSNAIITVTITSTVGIILLILGSPGLLSSLSALLLQISPSRLQISASICLSELAATRGGRVRRLVALPTAHTGIREVEKVARAVLFTASVADDTETITATSTASAATDGGSATGRSGLFGGDVLILVLGLSLGLKLVFVLGLGLDWECARLANTTTAMHSTSTATSGRSSMSRSTGSTPIASVVRARREARTVVETSRETSGAVLSSSSAIVGTDTTTLVEWIVSTSRSALSVGQSRVAVAVAVDTVSGQRRARATGVEEVGVGVEIGLVGASSGAVAIHVGGGYRAVVVVHAPVHATTHAASVHLVRPSHAMRTMDRVHGSGNRRLVVTSTLVGSGSEVTSAGQTRSISGSSSEVDWQGGKLALRVGPTLLHIAELVHVRVLLGATGGRREEWSRTRRLASNTGSRGTGSERVIASAITPVLVTLADIKAVAVVKKTSSIAKQMGQLNESPEATKHKLTHGCQ